VFGGRIEAKNLLNIKLWETSLGYLSDGKCCFPLIK
jgi:hypothetical protein